MKSLKTPLVLACATLLSLGSLAICQGAAQAAPIQDSSMSSNQPVTDTWITTKVKSELASTGGVKSTDVSVNTMDGVVTLTGVLANDVAVKKAVAAAQSVKGVKSVDSSGLKSRN
jgi:hyperosmotically inducible periplasmic protein